METQENTYCLYARKSSEQDERQALSIESQLDEMKRLAKDRGLEIAEIKMESHSAKAVGQRPVFNQMLKEIDKGKYQGIITWAADRLSRNAGDLGTLVDLMDTGKLIEIFTSGQTFTNDPNSKFLLMILGSQAKLENDNRGKNVMRGMEAKCSRGWRPGIAPIGYVNEKHYERGRSQIFVDPVRGPIISEMFRKVGIEEMSGRRLLRWAVHEQGLRTRSGKRVVLSTIYDLLKNPFYYGEFEWPMGSGKWYKGKHEPLTTKELFEQVKAQLQVTPKGGYRSKDFAFRGAITCVKCGRKLTATEKVKILKSTGLAKRYVYYHCSKDPADPCREPYIREEKLVKQLIGMLDILELNKPKLRLKFADDFGKFMAFSRGVLGQDESEGHQLSDKDYQSYLSYIWQHGSLEERKAALTMIKSNLLLDGGVLVLEKTAL